MHRECIPNFLKHGGYVHDYIFSSFTPFFYNVYDYMPSRSRSPGNFRVAESRLSAKSNIVGRVSECTLCLARNCRSFEGSLVHPLALGAREIPRRGGHGARSSEAAA